MMMIIICVSPIHISRDVRGNTKFSSVHITRINVMVHIAYHTLYVFASAIILIPPLQREGERCAQNFNRKTLSEVTWTWVVE
jgi:hypothetical protein